jgi:hypothetical protein
LYLHQQAPNGPLMQLMNIFIKGHKQLGFVYGKTAFAQGDDLHAAKIGRRW